MWAGWRERQTDKHTEREREREEREMGSSKGWDGEPVFWGDFTLSRTLCLLLIIRMSSGSVIESSLF